MIEAAVCFFLIALGVGAWALTRLGKRVYGQRPPPQPGAEVSFLATLFGNYPEAPADSATPRSSAGADSAPAGDEPAGR